MALLDVPLAPLLADPALLVARELLEVPLAALLVARALLPAPALDVPLVGVLAWLLREPPG
jgi:hypothetical protein